MTHGEFCRIRLGLDTESTSPSNESYNNSHSKGESLTCCSVALTSLHTSFPYNQEVADLRLRVLAIHTLDLEFNNVSFWGYLCSQLPSVLGTVFAFPFVIVTCLFLFKSIHLGGKW